MVSYGSWSLFWKFSGVLLLRVLFRHKIIRLYMIHGSFEIMIRHEMGYLLSLFCISYYYGTNSSFVLAALLEFLCSGQLHCAFLTIVACMKLIFFPWANLFLWKVIFSSFWITSNLRLNSGWVLDKTFLSQLHLPDLPENHLICIVCFNFLYLPLLKFVIWL